MPLSADHLNVRDVTKHLNDIHIVRCYEHLPVPTMSVELRTVDDALNLINRAPGYRVLCGRNLSFRRFPDERVP